MSLFSSILNGQVEQQLRPHGDLQQQGLHGNPVQMPRGVQLDRWEVWSDGFFLRDHLGCCYQDYIMLSYTKPPVIIDRELA